MKLFAREKGMIRSAIIMGKDNEFIYSMNNEICQKNIINGNIGGSPMNTGTRKLYSTLLSEYTAYECLYTV